jgi:hypothetical protein
MALKFALTLMIVVVSFLGVFATHTSPFVLTEVSVVGVLAGAMRVRARLRPGQDASGRSYH